jgi:ribosomal protein S1
LKADPWEELISKYKVGDIVDGDVQKVVDFGAFVRIDKGLNGLVHISEMSDKLVKDPKNIVNEGDEVKVKILSISSTERHLGLSLKWREEEDSTKSKIASQDSSEEKVSRSELAEKVEEALKEEVPSDK